MPKAFEFPVSNSGSNKTYHKELWEAGKTHMAARLTFKAEKVLTIPLGCISGV